ncbi:hypothetical protein JF66_12140 [Cryobacterium sp. MLB-32]|nr:hypothetical protein JF66_12140 [Cryobacterium sp. MLB-32]
MQCGAEFVEEPLDGSDGCPGLGADQQSAGPGEPGAKRPDDGLETGRDTADHDDGSVDPHLDGVGRTPDHRQERVQLNHHAGMMHPPCPPGELSTDRARNTPAVAWEFTDNGGGYSCGADAPVGGQAPVAAG